MSNQGLRQASIRASTGTAGTYEEDWLALFDDDGIPAGTFNERLYAWLAIETGLSGRTLDELMVAWAVTQGVATWNQLGALTLTPAAPPAAPVIDLLAISDRGASTTDNITNDPLPQFSIDLPDDTEAGDVVRLKVDGSTVATHTLTSGDLSGGEFFMGAAPLADGTYDFTTTLADAGGESVASNTETVTIDTSLGAATLALAAGGLITADTTPTMRVSNAAAVENDIAEVRSSTGTVLGTKTWDATDASNGYADATLSALSVAEHTLTAYVYGTAGGSGAGTFSAVTVEILEIAAALAISGTPVLTATEDTAYAGFTASATGGVTPYVFSLQGTWPAGLSIDSGTGVVSGTPTESGSFASLSVRVTDDEGSTDDLATFTLEVEAAAPAFALTFTDDAVDPSDSAAYPFAGMSFGAADATRRIIVGIAARHGTNLTQSLGTVTIGGVTASVVKQSTSTNGGGWEISAIVIADVPTGTTGDVVVNITNGATRCGIAVWSMIGASSGTASATGSHENANPLTGNLNIPTNGVAVGIATGTGGTSAAWTNLTERVDAAMESTVLYSAADATFTTGGVTALTCTWSVSPSTGPTFAFATWAP